MKVLHLSTDDHSGGAQRAAYRLHQACSQQGIDSSMRVLDHQTNNVRIRSGKAPRPFLVKVRQRLESKIHERTLRSFSTDNRILHSFGRSSAGIVQELNASDADVLNLHWIVNLLSIEDIGRLTKPLVWTLHDMWAFCGGEHYAPDAADARFRRGYLPVNRPAGERGPDLNRTAWEAKRRHWGHLNINFVSPSRWMADCLQGSSLFKGATVHVIPNPIDTTELWRPIDKNFARKSLGLTTGKKYILTGSAGGNAHIKGEDLLPQIMQRVAAVRSDDVELLTFGRNRPSGLDDLPIPARWLGPVRDDHAMKSIYSAADVMLVTSRQDNLPNTAVEANACGTPVVAFAIGGLTDIVSHETTGWLAKPFDTEMFAQGIVWILEGEDRRSWLSASARRNAVANYSDAGLVGKYLQAYHGALDARRVRA